MQIRSTQRLQSHLHLGTREARRLDALALMPDITMLWILRDRDSHAHKLMRRMVREWELDQIVLRLERDITLAAAARKHRALNDDPHFILGSVFEGLEWARASVEHDGASTTGHYLLWLTGNRELIAKRILELYSIDAGRVMSELMISPEGDEGAMQSPAHEEFDEEEDYPGDTMTRTRPRTAAATKTMIDKYAANLTRMAAEGRIDPVVGRTREIERLVQILGRRKKNNPVLIGEAGVGKTAVVEGLALLMAAGSAPKGLQGKQIYSLDMASLVAGTKYRGEFEQRLKELLGEITERRDVILFIDEIHTIVGAGSTQGGLDTANIMKPTLARGELQCIGATTLDEYRENIEKDGALERRFQKILVEPTSKSETLEILQNVRPVYERHHGVKYTDAALEACVELTDRYISDRNFPDKAIDLLDEAGSANAGSNIDVLHIEAIVTSMTGIPVERISQDDRARLAGMNAALSSRVIGQQEAVGKVVRSIQRSRAGLKDPNKPIGVFMFVGPTGVGKTHLTKELARQMFLRPDALIRVDMSEYSEKHNVSRMIGSPPGYVGYNEGGQLTEAVRRQPYSVILFDEIEKAHPDVFNIMLQIFDDGQLTDGNGRKVDFRNTIIIMTSNVGSRALAQKPAPVGYIRREEPAAATPHYRTALDATFAPEFINRIDDIVVFNTLSAADVERIVRLELDSIVARAAALGITLTATACARKRLAEMGYDPRYGVRSLKRTLLGNIEEPLAELIIEGGVELVQIECAEKGGIKLTRKALAAAA